MNNNRHFPHKLRKIKFKKKFKEIVSTVSHWPFQNKKMTDDDDDDDERPSLYSPQIKIFGSFFQQQSLSQRLHVFIAQHNDSETTT